MRRTMAKASVHAAANLLFFATLATVVLASTYFLTRDSIAKSVEDEKLKLIAQVVPQELFDNAIVQDTVQVPASELLGTSDTTAAYVARLGSEASAVVLQPIAPDGYSGKIFLIVAIRSNGELSGVRVVSHRETPGLGDYIELPKSPWIKGFDGQSHEKRKEAAWKVKKDGGQFDYVAGATITPRAIVKAVHKSLLYFEQNRDQLLAANPQPAAAKEARK
ncbi:electron transport complex subunit G [Ferrigenium kumadai]|uniref:Ion-translocating oxidoreductase complex subunit G n=1 Tax=Ferrigenium kumadai TaxID=1682490 RepID=A0AAN1T045_9PROT|nr:electron transport complex subunit RsxG [Ferrigenium kumadai]BBJ00244.1 electron transport complex subunit G [Ferrigenium kumadai]